MNKIYIRFIKKLFIKINLRLLFQKEEENKIL